jgi:hypothetical protein
LTLLLLPREDDEVSSSEIISLLDAATDAPGWIPLFEPRTVEALTIQDDEGEEAHVKNSGSPVSCAYHTSLFMLSFFGLASNAALVPHQTITPHSRKHSLPLVTELSRRNPKSPGLILLPAMGTAELGKLFGTPDPRQY